MHDLGRLHHHHREPGGTPISGRRRSVALGTLCLSALIAGIDMTIVNVALPAIGHALDTSTNQLQWTVDAYNIMLTGLLVLGGALADREGRRLVLLASFIVFGLASLVAAFSPSIGVLIGARALMGLGAAGVTAPALAIIASMFPPEERGGAISMFVIFGATGLAAGPIAGGLLLDHFWWGSVFLVNVPIVAVAVALGARSVPESRAPLPADGRGPDLDVLGAVLSVVGLGALLFGVIEGPGRGWTSPVVVAGLIIGVVGLAGFVVRELRVQAPLFDIRILLRPAVATGSVTLVFAFVLFSAFLFLEPQYLQDVRGQSIVAVGLLLAPFAVVFGLCSRMSERVVGRLGARVTIASGLVVSAAAAAALAVTTSGALWTTVTASVILGVGLSVLVVPPSTVVMNDLPASKAGDGSSLNFVSRFSGASVGVAIVGSIVASVFVRNLGPAAPHELGPAQLDRAEGSLQGALEVARTLGPSAGGSLRIAARDAFDRGATVAYAAVAVLALAAAAVAWVILGRSSRPVGGGSSR